MKEEIYNAGYADGFRLGYYEGKLDAEANTKPIFDEGFDCGYAEAKHVYKPTGDESEALEQLLAENIRLEKELNSLREDSEVLVASLINLLKYLD